MTGFLENLKKARIEVIFVCDGALPTSRREKWICRRYAEVKSEIIPTLDSIREGVYPNFAINREKYPNANIISPNKYNTRKLMTDVPAKACCKASDEVSLRMADCVIQAAQLRGRIQNQRLSEGT